MNDNNKDKLLDHDYDGIQEYDNDLPRWWLNIFYITIIIGVVYIYYVHFSGAKTDYEILADQVTEIDALRAKNAPAEGSQNNGPAEEKRLMALVKDDAVVALGKKVYMTHCAACHNQQAQGLVGPNLVDKYWVHGGKPTEIRHVIQEGVLEKGMLAWKTTLKPKEIEGVISYILSLAGTTPSNPKKAEGKLFNE